MWHVENVKDRSNTPKGCNAMYVEDVEDVKDTSNTPKGCNAMYVKDVKDTSNTPKSCNGWKALSLSFPKLFSDWKAIKY